jgi:hypothetical protein
MTRDIIALMWTDRTRLEFVRKVMNARDMTLDYLMFMRAIPMHLDVVSYKGKRHESYEHLVLRRNHKSGVVAKVKCWIDPDFSRCVLIERPLCLVRHEVNYDYYIRNCTPNRVITNVILENDISVEIRWTSTGLFPMSTFLFFEGRQIQHTLSDSQIRKLYAMIQLRPSQVTAYAMKRVNNPPTKQKKHFY